MNGPGLFACWGFPNAEMEVMCEGGINSRTVLSWFHKETPMSIARVIEPTPTDSETEEILVDPEVRAALEVLEDAEDREDLIDHLKAMKRFKQGKDKGIPWEEVKASLGL
jgi:hypothetical protein